VRASDNTGRTRELLEQIRDAEQSLDRLRAELARLVGEKRATVCGVRD
jgi:phage shock protein A